MKKRKYNILLYDEGSHTGLYGGQLARIQLFKQLNLDRFNPLLLTSKKSELYYEAIKNEINVITNKDLYRFENRIDRANFSYFSTIVNFTKIILSSLTLVNIIYNNKIDILFPNDNYSRVLACLSKLLINIKIVTYLSDDYKNTVVEKLLTLIIFSFSDIVFLPSKYLYKKYSNYSIARKKIIYNNPGINRKSLNNDKINNNFNSIDSKQYKFCIIGSLIPIKGHKILFEAIKMIRYENYLCYIIGSGPKDYVDYLNRLAIKFNITNKVKFLGFVDKPYVKLNDYDFLISASFSEANPRVIQESYHCKKPVIATKVGGQTELIIDGETGILVKPDHPESLANGIMEMLKKDKLEIHKMGQSGYKFVMSNYSFTNSVKFVEKKITELIN